MDIKDLNKTQIVLLCFLVAFVSSIATGITVVRLMTEQIALSSPQPVNRIIRQTIEKVVSSNDENSTPIIVSEEALLVSAIETISPYVVSVTLTSEGVEPKTIIGTVLENNTVVIDESKLIKDASYVMDLGGEKIPLVQSHTHYGLAYFTFIKTDGTEKAFSKKSVGVLKTIPKNGQTIFAFDGFPLAVTRGTIARIVPLTDILPATIRTTFTSTTISSGTPIADTSGMIVGIALVSEEGITVVLGSEVLDGLKK